MTMIFLFGAGIVLLGILLLMFRNADGRSKPAIASGGVPAFVPSASAEPEKARDLTGPSDPLRPSSGRIRGLPKLITSMDPESDSHSSKSALTIYESDADQGLDEPTGPTDLIVLFAVGKSDTGRLRRRNEDSYLVVPEYGLYVVADGMGGHAGGDVASNLAVTSIRSTFENQSFSGDADPKRPRRGNELVWAIERANRDVYATATSNDDYTGMGTTLLAARFNSKKRRVYIGHVGDSRCYRFRAGALSQLTSDHTLAASGVTGPFATHLSRALGVEARVKVDLVIDAPRHDDLYLLCSDGLPKMVSEESIREILSRHAALEDTAQMLVQRANDEGGRDNITVILLRVEEHKN